MTRKNVFGRVVLGGAILTVVSLWYLQHGTTKEAASSCPEKNITGIDESVRMHLKEGSHPPTAVEDGMLSMSEIVAAAQEEAFMSKTCDTNFPPTISFSNNQYKVTHWMRENPFRRGSRYYDSIALVDPWTGEVAGIEFGQYGTGLYGMEPSSLGLSDEERATNLRRVGVAVNKLNTRILRGSSLSDDLRETILLPSAVLEDAQSYAVEKKRSFDHSKAPLVVLVEDVYVIVLWKKPEAISEDGALYDSRVFIDAFSGEIIGLETTQ